MTSIITPELLTKVQQEDLERAVPRYMAHWPYCEKCKMAFQFDQDEPFAHCRCGTTEWGYPRPHDWVEQPQFQERASAWAAHTFGDETISREGIPERCKRFTEEAVELVQAAGFPKEKVLELVDFVYSRPVGNTHQEVAGVQVSLACLATALDVDMPKVREQELVNIWSRVDEIREKRKTKPE